MKSIIEKTIAALMLVFAASGALADNEPAILNDAYLWLDASTLTGSSGDEVASWASRNAGGKTASTTGTKPTISSTQLDGKNVVDFGDPGSGKDLSFDRSTTIRTVFMVADVADNANVFLLGDSNNYNFHRGTGKQYFYSYGTDALVSGTYRNGIKVENPRGTTIPTGFGLITLVANANVAACNICQDRTQDGRNGGKKIAELIIFNKTLTDAERGQVEEYLMEKWLGYCYRKASVSEDTTWSALVWDKAKPDSVPDSQCTYTVNITDNATLDLDDATIAAQSIIFDIATDKTLTLNGTATITGANISVTGSGKLKLNTSNPGCAITVASGATMDITTVESVTCAITNNGTLNISGATISGAITASSNGVINFTDCTVNGGVSAAQNGNVTINTYGTVTFGSSANNDFQYSTTLNVESGTSTYNSAGEKLLWCNINVKTGATFVNAKGDSFKWDADAAFPIHAYIWGTLTMNAKWTLGSGNYIHLYNGAVVNGNGHLHFNTGTGKVVVEEGGDYTIAAPFNTGNGTAKVEVKGSATLTLSTVPNNLKIEKAGTGTLKWANKNLIALSGTGGTIEIEAESSSLEHTFTSSTFDGVLKLTGASKQNNLKGNGSTRCFADNVRPELIADAMETYLSKDAYNGQTLYVRNLSGRSGAKLDARYTSGPISYTLDTLQERDTEYLGIFNNNSGDDRTFALNVTGNNVGGIHTLTLGGDNASTNTLTVSNYAKVKFSSSGKWSKGIVVVGSNGVLESQNNAAIAAKLKVEEGATLKFANGVPLAATAYDWSGVSNDGSVNIDLSAVAPSTTPVTLIARDVDVTEDKFTVRGAKTSATLSVEDGALKVTFANIWRNGAWDGTFVAGDDAVFYLSQNSTLTVSEALSLGAVTVVKEGEGNVTLTISGEGALTTGGWMIPSGVTVNTSKSMSISGTISGDGVLNIPASTTVAMNDVTCSNKITVFGTLETSGTTTLSGSNEIDAGGRLNVLSGKTAMSFRQQYFGGLYNNAYITIDSGAELEFSSNDPIFYNGYAVVNVKGTLTLGSGKGIKLGTNTPINIYPGGVIGGAGTIYPGGGDGTRPNSTIKMFASDGDDSASATISCAIQTGAESQIAKIIVEEGVRLVCSGNLSGSKTITKQGAGTLDLTAASTSVPLAIDAGVVSANSAPTTAVVVNEGGVFELISTSNVNDSSYGTGPTSLDLSKVTGGGTLKYSSTAGWRAFPDVDARMPASTLTLQTELADSLIITKNNGETVVGSLSGSKNIRSDFGTNGANGRILTITQSKDTEWQGKFVSNRLTQFNVVAPAMGTPGTLTLSGTQTLSDVGNPIPLNVSGSVNLTGTWVGATTVAGTFGGTGSLTGALTFNAGSTFKVWETGSLTVSGVLTLPGSGKVNVDVSAISLSNDGTTIMTFGSVSGTIAAFSCDHAILEFDGTSLKAYPAVASVTLADGSSISYSAIGGAQSQASANINTYQYITILADMSFTPGSYKYKIANGVNVTPLPLSDEYLTPTANDPDSETGAFTYNSYDTKATSYTWTGADTYTLWSRPGNWVHGESVVAFRCPTTGDDVLIDTDATITLGANVEVDSMSIGAAVTLAAASAKTLTVTDSISLTDSAATLAIPSTITLVGTVTTDVDDKVVKSVVDGGTTTYSVVDPVAQIGDVKYGSLDNAVGAAETDDEITLLANTSVGSVGKAITLDIGTYTLTLISAGALDSISSLTGTGTLVLPSDSLPTSSLQTLLKNSTNWNGTLALSGLTQNTAPGFNFSNYGNVNSKIQLTNCWIKYLDNESSYFEGCLVLCDDVSHNPAFKTSDGYSDRYNKFGELAGNGAIYAGTRQLQMYSFLAASNFTGSITIEGFYDTSAHKYDGRRIVFGEPLTPNANGTIDNAVDPASIRIKPGVQVGLGEGAAWNASYGIYIGGTVIVNGNASLTSNKVLDHESDATPPNNLRGDKHIVFYDGAKLLYKKLCTVTTTGDVTLAEGSVVAIAFADGVSPVDGTQLISWSAPPAGTFAFDNGNGGTTDTLTVGGIVYTLSSENNGLYLRKAVAFTYDGVPPVFCYYPSVAAALSAGTNIYLYDAPNETVTLEAGKTININGKDVSNLTVNSALAEYASPIAAVDNAYSLANATSAPVTYYWTGATDSLWTTIGNWKVNASDGPAATRAMEATDSVAFTDGAIVALGATRRVAGIAIDGTVYISAVDAATKSLETTGNITGTGTLTLSDVCLANVANNALTVASAVHFTNDSELAATGGYGFTFTGSVSISDTIKVWNVDQTVTGTTTLSGNFTKAGGNFGLTLGNVVVSASTEPTISAGSITFGGTVSVASDATLSIPSSGLTYNSATFTGFGTVSFGAVPTSALTFSSWTGTVVLPSFQAGSGHNLNNYGIEGSKVQLTGITGGWLDMSTTTINPEIVLAGNVTLTDSSTRTWTFKKVSGTGNLSLTPGTNDYKITIRINDLASTIGTISNNMGSDITWTIDKLSFPAETELPAGTKLLSTGGEGAITLGSITVDGVALSNVSYSRNKSGADGDGFYVNAAATTTGTGDEAVTTVTTDASTTSVAVTLDDDYSGKIAIPANVATLTVTGPTITAGQLQLVTTQGTYDNLLSYSAGAVSLNPSAYYQNGEGEANKIYVEPKTAASDPMTMPGATTAPSFSIKTIPGLYYAVQTGSFNGSGEWVPDGSSYSGDAVQATSVTTAVTAPALDEDDVVKYYRIGVGLTPDGAK